MIWHPRIRKVAPLLVCISIVFTLFLILIPNRAISDSTNNAVSSRSSTTATVSNSRANSTMTNSTSFVCCTPILLAPIAATTDNNVYVIWSSNNTGHFEILFRASSDNGKTFSDKVELSNTTQQVNSVDPQIAASANHVYISWWEDYGNGTRVPLFRASQDSGHTFGPTLSLSDNGPIPRQDSNTTAVSSNY